MRFCGRFDPVKAVHAGGFREQPVVAVTPYVIDRTKRMGYSLRATGIKAGRPMAQSGKDAA
jgi:hypothetical protein